MQKRESEFDIEKVRKLCHVLQSMDRYMSRVQSKLMPDNKREALEDLRAEMKKLTDDRKELFSDDEQRVYGRAKKLLGF